MWLDISIVERFLPEKECADIIRLAEDRLTPSEVVVEATGGRERHRDRVSHGMSFKKAETPFIASVENRIAALAGVGVYNLEDLQVLRYKQGGFYRPHFDYFSLEHEGSATLLSRGGQRVATVIIYLNTPRAGGETVFPNIPLTVNAEAGKAVHFKYTDSNVASLHGGNPVLSGEKWIITAWVRSGIFL
jgi:prolyl 4-hydroxylase